jgi:hypothetical protein
MFKILASDGKEYGPVAAEQLRQWIREGRAGGPTQVRREGDANWQALHSLPEFADIFQAPPAQVTGRIGLVPPVVRTFGILNIVVGLILLLQLVATLFSLLAAMRRSGSFNPFNATFLFFQALGVLGVIIRIVSGIGLLRGMEWARRLAVYYAGFALVLGVYGLGRTLFWLGSNLDAMPHALLSFSYVFNLGLSFVTLAFNVATIILLTRPAVRTALAAKTSAAV